MEASQAMDDILTVFKASQYCNVSPKTIINWIEAGHIKAYKTVGGHRRIKRVRPGEPLCERRESPFPTRRSIEPRKRILVVDDDPIIVETIVQALEEDDMTMRSFRPPTASRPGCRSTISSPIS